MEMLVPFHMLYADGVERLGAESLLERQKWVNRLWYALDHGSYFFKLTYFLQGSGQQTSGNLRFSFCHPFAKYRVHANHTVLQLSSLVRLPAISVQWLGLDRLCPPYEHSCRHLR